LPRYRHGFSVSNVLDDTIWVFREVWLRMIGLNLIARPAGRTAPATSERRWIGVAPRPRWARRR
jgi:hypothetical protein